MVAQVISVISMVDSQMRGRSSKSMVCKSFTIADDDDDDGGLSMLIKTMANTIIYHDGQYISHHIVHFFSIKYSFSDVP